MRHSEATGLSARRILKLAHRGVPKWGLPMQWLLARLSTVILVLLIVPLALVGALVSYGSETPRPSTTQKSYRPGQEFQDCNDCPTMVVIPSGSFTMGSDNDGSQHEVTIPHAFAVGKFEVTFDEWAACVSAGGCNGYQPDDEGWGRGKRPVMRVSWEPFQELYLVAQWQNG